MVNIIVTLRIMPESPDVDLKHIEVEALKMILDFAGKGDTKIVVTPIAFGLNAVDITFIMDESLGSPDVLEEKIMTINGVNSFETKDVRRAIG